MQLTNNRIFGTRLYLRRLSEKDATPEYLSWLNDPEIQKYLETPPTNSTEQLKEYIRKQNENPNSLFLGIFDRKTNRHIGNIKLEPIDWQKKTARFGTLIGNKAYWNNGYGTEASRLILKYAFEEMGLEKVDLGVIEYNQRAINCYKKSGFKVREIVPKCLNHEGVIYDNVMMEISKEEFEEKMLLSKLALGTVQFGMDYGISNQRGKIPKEEVFRILDLAAEKGINLLDSAYAYGESEQVIGEYSAICGKKFKIVSKLPGTNTLGLTEKSSPGENLEKIKEDLDHSLKRLNHPKLYAYLIYDFKAFLARPEVLEDLKKIKKMGLTEKIGFSLYHPRELEYLLDNNFEFDLVQIPYNIFDQRFACLFPRLKEKGIEIHVRSVFLQGLIFKNPDKLEEYFLPLKEKLKSLNSISQRLNTLISALCLNFALLNEDFDKVIIGVESYQNFQENILAAKSNFKVRSVYSQLLTMREDDEKIILPTNWPKKKK